MMGQTDGQTDGRMPVLHEPCEQCQYWCCVNVWQDGYRQLATLSPAALKGIIRVKFINEQVSPAYSHVVAFMVAAVA